MLRSRRCSRRSARGQREWEARESIRGSKLSEAAMRAPGEERRDPKKSATARKSSSVLINKNKTTCTHTFVHSTPLKCIITTPPDHQSLDSKKKKKNPTCSRDSFPSPLLLRATWKYSHQTLSTFNNNHLPPKLPHSPTQQLQQLPPTHPSATHYLPLSTHSFPTNPPA